MAVRKSGGSGGGARFAVRIAIQAHDMATRVARRVADGVARAFDGIKARIRSVVDFASKLGTAFSTWGSMAIGVAQRVAGVLEDVADRFGAIADTSAKTGVSTTVLQELEHAAQLSGVPIESLHKGIEVLNRKLGEMRRGSGDLAKMLTQTGGPAFLQQVKGAQDTGAALELMLAAMAKIPDEQRRAAFAANAFGKAGEDLALLAASGADELKRLRLESHALGQQSEDNIQAAAEFGDELDKLKAGARFVIDTAAIETMRQLLPDLRAITDSFKNNREHIAQIARDIGGGVADAIRSIKNAFVWIYDHREEVLTWAKALAVVFGAGGILGSVNGIVAGLRTMLGLGGAGAAAAAGGGAAQAGAVSLAGTVAGPALAAAFLPDQGKIDTASQRGLMDVQAEERRRRIAVLGPQFDAGIWDIASMKGPAASKVFEGFQALADAVAVWKLPGAIGDAANVVGNRLGAKSEITLRLEGPAADQATVTKATTDGQVTVVQPGGKRTVGTKTGTF